MVRSLWTAATGMNGQQYNMDTISNNLSNVNTTGFKQQRVEFEDLIYHYDDTTKRIIDWLGLDESQHTRKFAGLNPANSIKNTQLWKQHPEYLKEADYIKEYLSEYIYNFQEGV